MELSYPYEPDLRVGIDFGTTSTGVAWCLPIDPYREINVLSEWPGMHAINATGEKVPTVLAKGENGKNTPWGFLCHELDETETWHFFKTFMDPVIFTKHQASGYSWIPENMAQVSKIVMEYLHQIYAHISVRIPELIKRKTCFYEHLPGKGWEDWKVEFVFSVTTTWKLQVIQRFRNIIREAGFGKAEPHAIVLGLTEAEAAAAFMVSPHALTSSLDKDAIVLCIDAGGGTTDLAFVKASTGGLSLEEVMPISGVGIGSTAIDDAFSNLVKARLRKYPDVSLQVSKTFASGAGQMPGFQHHKHMFGKQPKINSDELRILASDSSNSYSHSESGIENGRFLLKPKELQSFFDAELGEIQKLITKALQSLKTKTGKSVSYVALSGGLGSSQYVFQALQEFFLGLDAKGSLLHKTQFLDSPRHPRLVVVQGLLLNRTDATRAISSRIARASYGIVIDAPYSHLRYFNQPKITDHLINQGFLTGEIRWLVKAGDTITPNSRFRHTFVKPVSPDGPRCWPVKLVCCDWFEDDLPINMKGHEGLECGKMLISQHNTSSSTKTKRFFFKKSFEYCQFDVYLKIGACGDYWVDVSKNVTISEFTGTL